MNTELNEADLSLLAALREARPDCISGEALADRLGVSRVSIKSRLDRLRAQGFVFEAVRSQGYTLTEEPNSFHPLLLEQELRERNTAVNWLLLEECASTNDETMRRLTEGAEEPLIVVARRQTSGRGRLGRKWHSDDGNLMFSFGVRPNRPPAFMQRFTVWVGLRLAARLSELSGAPVQAKWPNDLLINGRKLAGILTESRMDADRIRELILGLGLNVNSDVDAWPEEVRAIATSLSRATGRKQSMSAVAATIFAELVAAYKAYCQEDIDEELAKLWEAHSAIKDQRVTISTYEGEVSGRVTGIDASSALVLQLDNGESKTFAAGDVSLQGSYQPKQS